MKSSLKLKPENRLKKREDFLNLYENGIKISGFYYAVFCLPGKLPESRFGITVSKRLGNAVFRNHEKRIVREAVRQHLPDLTSSLDFVIVLMKSAQSGKSRAKSRELLRLILWLIDFKFS